MKILYPDYTNCALNVASSIMRYFGVPCPHPTHETVDGYLKNAPKNVVLMLFDGMAINILEKALPEDAFLRRHIAREMTAVFPSTTTNATSCVETGQSPREHAWLGWTLYFKEIDKPVDIFINRSEGEIAADYHVADRFIPREFIFDKIARAGMGEASCVSPFGDTRVKTLDELFDTALSLARDDKKRYIYTYWGDPDHTMHGEGCYTDNVLSIVRDLNARAERFYAEMPAGTLLMLTADHGLINARHHYIEDHPELLSMLVRYPSVESRAATFFVKPECLTAFPDAFRAAFGENFLLVTREAFIHDYLGPGRERDKLRDFLGDYMALATDLDCIDGKRGDFELVGVHAGLTENEMRVPLIALMK